MSYTLFDPQTPSSFSISLDYIPKELFSQRLHAEEHTEDPSESSLCK